MFATGIESSYPAIEGGRWRMDLLEVADHYKHGRTDLQPTADVVTGDAKAVRASLSAPVN